jgi:hypothetical protein
MGLFGKTKAQEQQEANRLRQQTTAAEVLAAERELQRKTREVERWGFDRKSVSAPTGDDAGIEVRFAGLFDEYIEPFRKGVLEFPKLATFLDWITSEQGHPEIARTHPEFSTLVLQVLRKSKSEWWPSLKLKPAYRFSYPSQFHLVLNHLGDVDENVVGGCRPATVGVSAIGLLEDGPKQEARAILLEAAKQPSLFDLVFLACVEHGWVRELEEVLREAERFDDVLKVLLFLSDWDAVVAWLRQHGRHLDSVKVLEARGRFGEAAALLDRLGPEAVGCSEKALAKESARLKRLAELAPAGRSAQERVPAGACPSCGKAVSPEFLFCPFCGKSLA